MNDFPFFPASETVTVAQGCQAEPQEMPPEALFKTSTCYAGIGSRNTPRPILILMGEIAQMLADYGLTLRSGGAPGADTAFENGCDRRGRKKEIFLPWKGFNNHPSPFFDPPKDAHILASFCHPNWKACQSAARHLHARNCQQVMGLNLDDPVDFVLLWAPEESGQVKGGTATAVNLARRMKIPTFNLWDESTHAQWKEVIATHQRSQHLLWRRVLSWLGKGESGDHD
jgi:hypothetical protein